MALHETPSGIPREVFDIVQRLGPYVDFDHLTEEQCEGVSPLLVKAAAVSSGLYAVAPHQESQRTTVTEE